MPIDKTTYENGIVWCDDEIWLQESSWKGIKQGGLGYPVRKITDTIPGYCIAGG